MNPKYLGRRATLGAAFSALFLAAMPASADTIDLAAGQPCGFALTCGPFSFTGATLTLSSNGNFEYKELNGATGLGISGVGITGGEIDVGEFVTGTFSVPTVIESFRVLFLYNGPEFGDPFELAQVRINGGAVVATLTPGAVDNTAAWSLPGTVVNCGGTTENGTGCFDILNPFGSTLITDITFTSLFSGQDAGHNSDFSLAAFEVTGHPTTVPEPATLLLLGTGALAAARVRRTRA